MLRDIQNWIRLAPRTCFNYSSDTSNSISPCPVSDFKKQQSCTRPRSFPNTRIVRRVDDNFIYRRNPSRHNLTLPNCQDNSMKSSAKRGRLIIPAGSWLTRLQGLNEAKGFRRLQTIVLKSIESIYLSSPRTENKVLSTKHSTLIGNLHSKWFNDPGLWVKHTTSTAITVCFSKTF